MMLEGATSYNVGEMAHIIAHSAGGPRSNGGKGSDRYDNLILLCPTCHRKIDKAPDERYPEQMLHEWKRSHEEGIRKSGSAMIFGTTSEIKRAVTRLLIENQQIWNELGPQSEIAHKDPGSNTYVIWNLRKLDRIIPNNHRIINMLGNNTELLSDTEYQEYIKFRTHADAFEANQYDRLDAYPTFPQSFAEAFRP